MEYVAIIFIFMSIGYTLLWIVGKVFRRKKPKGSPKQAPVNRYIAYHQAKINDDRAYEEYLQFCSNHGQAPMDKDGFNDLRQPERDIVKALNRKGNHHS